MVLVLVAPSHGSSGGTQLGGQFQGVPRLPFIPLLYLAGLAGKAADGVGVLVDGYAYGSLSMTAYTLGIDIPHSIDDSGAPSLDVPADESNI